MVLRQGLDTLAEQLADPRVQRADAQAQLGALWDHVGRVTGEEGADGDDRRLAGRHVARHHGLQRHDQRGADHHRVHCLVRHGTVATGAVDDDGRAVGGGHAGAGQHAEAAYRHAGGIVQGEQGVAGEQAEHALVEHAPGAGTAVTFLGGLEEQMQGAAPAAFAGQFAGRRQEHGGMPVMAAGVHLAGNAAAPGTATAFLDGQGVQLGAQAEGRPLAVAQGSDHGGAGQIQVQLVAPLAQVLDHLAAGGELLEAQLGLGVYGAAQFDHGRRDGGDAGMDRGCVHVVLVLDDGAGWLGRCGGLT
ncbi:hypothetical protein D9M68_505190 [compost metagenome]